MQDFKLVEPKGTVWGVVGGDPSVGYNPRMPRYHAANVQKGDNFMWEHVAYEPNSLDYMTVEQKIVPGHDTQVKINTVEGGKSHIDDPVYKSVETSTKDGFYSVARTKNGEIIGGYEVEPVSRKFAQGFKGKLQRFAMRLGTDANGCERPVLRRVSEFIINTLKKIK